MRRQLLFLVIGFFFITATIAQNDSLSKKTARNRKIILAGSSAGLTIGSLVYLNQAWYSEYNTGRFHFFDDNHEWLQMDKVGHLYSNYQMSRLMMEAFHWAGFSKQKTMFIGGTIGVAYMTAIECMDGYSKGWGFSWGDQISNVLGAGIALTQEALWHEQRIQVKFSYSQSGLAKYNPSLLGKTPYTQVLKDYNGQTYWLSVNPSSFLKKSSRFPKWLSIAVGYSAYGMLGAEANTFLVQDEAGNVLRFSRERRVLLSLDVDLSRINTRSKTLRALFKALNLVKIPAPSLQWSPGGFKAHYFYF